MGSSTYGYLERRLPDNSGWELVLKTEAVTGPDHNFMYILGAQSVFPSVPCEKGFPGDLGVETKALISISHLLDIEHLKLERKDLREESKLQENLEFGNESYVFNLRLRNDKNALHTTYHDLKDVWDDKVKDFYIDRFQERMKRNVENGGSIDFQGLNRYFNVCVSNDGVKGVFKDFKWHEEEFGQKEILKLISGEKVGKNGKEYALERKKRKELAPETWWPVWEIMEKLGETDPKSIRLVLYSS